MVMILSYQIHSQNVNVFVDTASNVHSATRIVYGVAMDLEKLRSELAYDPVTGIFTWKTARQGQPIIGSPAGVVDKSTGYRKIGWSKKVHYAHRLAWSYANGEIPAGYAVKQKDDNRDNCRLENLHLVKLGETRKGKRLAA